ncbi:MAG: hypothetical protein QXQ70_03030 [Candidatus Caldarchaeum sp.]
MKQIKIIINEDGEAQIETDGYKGPECLADVEKILQHLKELGLDIKTEGIKYKPEYYVNATTAKQKVGIR